MTNKNSWSVAFLALVVGVLAACGKGGEPRAEADAHITARLSQALSGSDVAQVEVVVSGPDFAPITGHLVQVRGVWQGTLGHIPVGSGRLFTATASDTGGNVLYVGEAGPMTIEVGRNPAVALLLQQASPPTPFSNEAPRITSLVASSAEVVPGDTVQLQSTAQDANGDALTFHWTGTAGTLSPLDAASTTWTAPDTEGDYTLTLHVTDTHGATNAISFSPRVRVSAGRGSADVTAAFNTWPLVAGVTSSAGRLAAGETAEVQVSASDVDGDGLAYAWEASCEGSLANPAAPSTTFSLTSTEVGTCTLSVRVTDGRGGVNTGSLTLHTGPMLPANVAPVIDSSFQAAESAAGGEALVLRVSAHDPEGAALSFSWSASIGDVTSQSDSASSSEVRWTAPSAFFSARATVTVTVADADGVFTRHTFTIMPLVMGTVGVTPASGNVFVGQTLQLTAVVTAPDGQPVPLAVTWASADPGLATVDASGLVTTHAAGEVRITATYEELSGSSVLTVVTGPAYPAPGGVTWASTGQMGRAGGANSNYSGFDLTATRFLAWGSDFTAPPALAFDGAIDSAGETMAFDAAGSELANGVLRWSGEAAITYMSGGAYATTTLPTRLTLTLSEQSGPSGETRPLALLSPAEAGVPASVGGVVRIAGTTPLVVNLRMEAQFGGTWQPALDLFDSLNTVPGTPVQTSFTGAFYYAP